MGVEGFLAARTPPPPQRDNDDKTPDGWGSQTKDDLAQREDGVDRASLVSQFVLRVGASYPSEQASGCR